MIVRRLSEALLWLLILLVLVVLPLQARANAEPQPSDSGYTSCPAWHQSKGICI